MTDLNKKSLLDGTGILKDDDTDDLGKHCRYGWFNYRPSFFQPLRHPWVALTILCACAFAQGFLVSGMVNVCISSVEKQFKLTSTQTGSVVSAYDIAFLLAATPISYAGGRAGSSKVRYLSVGMISLGLGSLVFASPQLFSPSYSYKSVSETCVSLVSKIFKTADPSPDSAIGPSYPATLGSQSDASSHTASSYYAAFFLGSFLNGIGGAPLYTLGVTYVDENTPAESVSLYLGIYYAFSMIGPAFGFFAGAYFLTNYVDFVKYIPGSGLIKLAVTLEDPDNPGPNWVGAWWLGFVACTAFSWFIAIPLSGLPARFPGMLAKFIARREDPVLIKQPLESSGGATNRDTSTISTSSKGAKASDVTGPSGVSEVDDYVSFVSRFKSAYGSVLSSTLLLFRTMKIVKSYDGVLRPRNEGSKPGEYAPPQPFYTAPTVDSKNADKLVIQPTVIGKGGTGGWKSGRKPSAMANFAHSVAKLLKNGTFLSITLAGAADGFVLNGFAAFLPKYLEMQFGTSAKSASLYVGYATIPAGVLGMLLGGYIIKRFKVTVMGMIRITFVASFLNFCCLLILLMTCPENRLAGVNYLPAVSHPKSAVSSSASDTFNEGEDWSKRRQMLSNDAKINFGCNHDCNCHYTFDPVCGQNDVMYYSACHAGCHGKILDGGGTASSHVVYQNCTCIPSTRVRANDSKANDESLNGSAHSGSCSVRCGNIILFLSFIFISLFLLLMVAVISVMITLKCVDSNENSLSMGVQWAIVRLLGTIPGPIIFGKIIDRNCLFWEIRASQPVASLVSHRGDLLKHYPASMENGACKLYNNRAMGHDLFLLMVVSKMTAQSFYGLACYTYFRYFATNNTNIEQNPNDRHSDQTSPTLKNTSNVDSDTSPISGLSKKSLNVPKISNSNFKEFREKSFFRDKLSSYNHDKIVDKGVTKNNFNP